MTKKELVDEIQEEVGGRITKAEVEAVLEKAFGAIGSAIAETGRFQMPGFGVWKKGQRKARAGINPQTKKPINIPAATTVKFKAAPQLKKAVAKS